MCNGNKYLNTHSRQLSSMKFFQTILQIFFLKSIFQQQRNNLLIDYLILDPILFHSSKTKRNKNIKKKEKEKEGRNKNNPSSNKNRNPRRKYKLIRWDKKKPRCITDWPPSDATRMKQFAFFFPLKPPSTSPSLLPSVLPSVFLLLYRASNKIERDSVTPARSQPRLFLHFLEH